jgi:O-antigen/teichoic acid export membrane protein
MIARKSALMFGANIISALLGYAGLFFVARFMGAHALGIVGFGLAYVGMFSSVAYLGFGTTHVKRISEGKDLATCIGTFARIKIALTVLMTCCILGSILFWKFLLGRGFESPLHEFVIYIMLFQAVFYTFSDFFLSTFLGRQEIAKYQLPYFMETVSRVACTVVVASLGLGMLALGYAWVAGSIAMFCSALLLFRGYPIGRYNKDYFKSYLAFAIPMFAVATVGTISVNVDKIMIQLFWSSTEVGYYFSTQKITDFVSAIAGVIGVLLFPTLSTYHAEDRIKELALLSRKAERYISLVIFPIVIFIIALAPQIISIILSDEFLPAVPVFRLLAVYSFIIGVNTSHWLQFGAINMPKLAAKIGLIPVVLNIVLNIIFIPSSLFGFKLLGLGPFGAAVTTVISGVVGVVISRFYTKMLTNTTTNLRTFIHLFAACLTGLLLYAFGHVIPLDRWFSLLGAGLLCIGIYLAILYSLKEFTKEDYHFFLDTLSPRKMFKYTKEELKQ